MVLYTLFFIVGKFEDGGGPSKDTRSRRVHELSFVNQENCTMSDVIHCLDQTRMYFSNISVFHGRMVGILIQSATIHLLLPNPRV